MVGDLGQREDLDAARRKALATGASTAYVEDLREEFVTEFIWPTLRAGAVYEHKYLLGTSFARPLLAQRQVANCAQSRRRCRRAWLHRQGQRSGALRAGVQSAGARAAHHRAVARVDDFVARRCHRVCQLTSHSRRADQREYLQPRPQYLAFEPRRRLLEDPANAPDEAMWQWVDFARRMRPDKPARVEIGFEEGLPVSVDGRNLKPLALLEELNELAAAHGVGRTDIVENRLVGIKSRGAYETPGGTLLVAAHRELETLALDRETAHYSADSFAALCGDGLLRDVVHSAARSARCIFRQFATARYRLDRIGTLQGQCDGDRAARHRIRSIARISRASP